jgi:uncharacterized protein YecA (UPF0149 family)
LTDLSPREAIEEITEAYDRGLVEPFMVSKEDVDKSIAEGDVAVQEFLAQCPPTGIADTIEELRHWAALREEPVKSPVKHAVPRLHAFPTSRNGDQVMAPAIAKRARIGRNDPCPCGVGKKFKKCCGSRRC